MFKGGCRKKVLKPEVKREVVNWWRKHLGQSIRRGCGLLKLNRSTYHYEKKEEDWENQEIRKRMRELAHQRPRFGSPRIHVMLRREGWKVNHKRTERIYSEEKLSIRRKPKKKRVSMVRVEPEPAKQMNEIWAMDFVSEKLWHNRCFRALTVIDVFTKECLEIKVDTSIGGEMVVIVLDRLISYHGKPKVIRTDNGSEFMSKAVDAWAYKNGVKQDFISPGKPVENHYIESFNGRFRDECLNMHYFTSLKEAKEVIEMWREDYNNVRPHKTLAQQTPMEFKQKHLTKTRSVVQDRTLVLV